MYCAFCARYFRRTYPEKVRFKHDGNAAESRAVRGEAFYLASRSKFRSADATERDERAKKKPQPLELAAQGAVAAGVLTMTCQTSDDSGSYT